MSQSSRVLRLLRERGEHGISPVDFAAPEVVDGGKPTRHCPNCGKRLEPLKRPGKPRVWCSELCRSRAQRTGSTLSDHLCDCGCGQRTPYAARTDTERGWAKGSPQPFIVGHARAAATRARQIARLDQFTVKDFGYETPCWVWTGHIARSGHGWTYLAGRARPAYRAIWEVRNGPVPPGLELHHLCENPPCVNPDHLEPVSRGDHQRRDGRARLSCAQVEEILTSDESQGVLAGRFGVSGTTIWGVRRGRHYQDWRREILGEAAVMPR